MDRFWVRRAAITCVVAVLLAACGSVAIVSPSSSAVVKPSPTAPATASPSLVPATPSSTPNPTATPTLELKTLDSITSAPLPKTAVTAQAVRDAVAPVIDFYSLHPSASDIAAADITNATNACLDIGIVNPNDRFTSCEGVVRVMWNIYLAGYPDAYAAAKTTFLYVLGPNGFENNATIGNARGALISFLNR
jgi:hypothetical protein